MQIQTVEEITGLDRATIRYYEQEGLIKPQRLQNGYRDYSDRCLQDLLKIKLLRQLGLSVETIHQLIEGREELQNVLTDQLTVIRAHKNYLENAESICSMMIQDNVTYQTIQPGKYFNAMKQIAGIDNKVIDAPKTEYLYYEVHPVRRFFGRYIDHLLASALLMLIVIVFLRVRPIGDFQNSLINIGANLLSMPLNALFLCLFGTTPGKFTMGIFLRNPEGKNLSFVTALQREWAVFRYGEGFKIPIYNLIRLYKSYQTYTTGLELEWGYDYDADLLYTDWTTRRPVYASILSAICAVCIIFSAQDSMLPKNRGADLTLAEFAENYNDYAKITGVSTYLSKEGKWYRPDVPLHEVLIGEYEEKWKFVLDDNEELVQINIEIDTDSRLSFLNEAKMENTVLTAFLSQPNADTMEANSAMNKIAEQTFYSNNEFNLEEQIACGDVIVKWEILKPEVDADTRYKILVEIVIP